MLKKIFISIILLLIIGCCAACEKDESVLSHSQIDNPGQVTGEQNAEIDINEPMISGTTESDGFSNLVEGKLVIDGKEVVTKNKILINCEEYYAILPVFEIAEYLGANIDWQSDTYALIEFDGQTYHYTSTPIEYPYEFPSLYDEHHDYILEPPGGAYYNEFVDKELMLDHIWARFLFKQVFGYDCSIDFDNLTVVFNVYSVDDPQAD